MQNDPSTKNELSAEDEMINKIAEQWPETEKNIGDNMIKQLPKQTQMYKPVTRKQMKMVIQRLLDKGYSLEQICFLIRKTEEQVKEIMK